MGNNQIMIAVTEIRTEILNIIDQPIEDIIRKSMELANNHWLLYDEDEKFKVAMGAVIINLEDSSEDKRRLEMELDILKNPSNAVMGLSTFNLDEVELENYNPIGIVKIWKEVIGYNEDNK